MSDEDIAKQTTHNKPATLRKHYLQEAHKADSAFEASEIFGLLQFAEETGNFNESKVSSHIESRKRMLVGAAEPEPKRIKMDSSNGNEMEPVAMPNRDVVLKSQSSNAFQEVVVQQNQFQKLMMKQHEQMMKTMMEQQMLFQKNVFQAFQQ